MIKNLPAVQERIGFNPWVGKIPWRREWLPTAVFLGFSCGSAGKESAYIAGDPGSIPGLGRSPGKGIGYPLQYSWASLVAQMVKNPPAMLETWVLSPAWEDFLEEGMATHFRPKDTYRLKVRGWKNILHSNGKQKKPGVAILISDKIDLKVKKITL